MKKFLLFAALLLAFPFFALAKSNLTFGGGVNSSYTDNEDEGSTEHVNRLGYNVGVGWQLNLLPSFSYVFEANLETRGETVRYSNGTNAPGEIFLRLQYVQVPVFLMIHIPAGKMTVDLFAGPVVGIPVSGEIESPGFVLIPGGGHTPPLTFPAGKRKLEDMNTQWGVEAGVGLDLPLGAFSLFVRPSYYHGFTTTIVAGENMDDAQRNIKLKAGVKLPL